MHDDITRSPGIAPRGELLEHSTDIAWDGTGLEGRALFGFAQLLPVGVHQRRPEILGLPDDTRVRHAHQLISHLNRDLLQSAKDHTRGYRVDRPTLVGCRAGAGLRRHIVLLNHVWRPPFMLRLHPPGYAQHERGQITVRPERSAAKSKGGCVGSRSIS